MNATSPAHYINQFIPDHAQPTETGIVHISPEIYQTIETFGELTLGSQKEISVFSAIKILAKENKEVRDLLSFTSTETGKKIDSMMLEALGDPWFESVLLYRPDMLISKNNAVFTNELEIVCGGFGIYFSSLLQKYFGEQKTLLDTMLNTMANYRKNLNLDGSLAIIGDQNAADYINQRKWLLKYYPDLVMAYVDELNFKNDGVYFKDKKIAVAQLYIKAHKLTQSNNENSIALLKSWLNKQIFVFSPPSLLMDNKMIMYLLQCEEYKNRLENLLGLKRYHSIVRFLPKTYFFDPDDSIFNKDHELVTRLLQEPWKHGKFIVKYASLWGGNKMIVSPTSKNEEWSQELNEMFSKTNEFGMLLVQELIDIVELPLSHVNANGTTLFGRTKFTPFFIHDIFSKKVTMELLGVNISPDSFRAHLDHHSNFALVELTNGK